MKEIKMRYRKDIEEGMIERLKDMEISTGSKEAIAQEFRNKGYVVWGYERYNKIVYFIGWRARKGAELERIYAHRAI